MRVKDSKGEYTDYYHLGSVKNKIGDKIKKGNNIGSAGSTDSHLHIDQWSEKVPEDYEDNPEKYLKKSYDEGKTYIYFRNPDDYK